MKKKIEESLARQTAVAALQNAGVPSTHAILQADLLIEAELCGRPSHGLLRLPRIVERIHNGVCNPHTQGLSVWRSASFLDVDGEAGLGPVVADTAIKAIQVRARETGVALAAVRHNNHLGMMSWYAERVAREGQILIALTTSEALVHPWGGRQAMVGTNPIAIGVPAQPRPFVLDMATSRVSMGEIHDRASMNLPIPADWALDAQGDPTTDAHAARIGAIAPFGGAKGYALALGFEVLVTALTGASVGRDVTGTLDSTQPCNKGDLFIVAQPSANGAAGAISNYLDAIRACPPMQENAPVSVPGDRAHASKERSRSDGIPLSAELWERLQTLAQSAR